MKKYIVVAGLLLCTSLLDAISTTMTHRTVSSMPLIYKQINYADPALSLEIEPWISGMFDPQHVMANLGINGQNFLSLNQEGLGDINPQYLLLGNVGADYTSTITLNPELLMFGALVHFYKEFDNRVFFDIRSALINCRSKITIAEAGGDTGNMSQPNGQKIYNAYAAFTQSDWNYGKIGDMHNVTSLDDVQAMLGTYGQVGSGKNGCRSYLAGFGLVQAPTGHGTNSQWLFEPQVGTNHWAFGGGLDYMAVADCGYSIVLGGNYRYIFSSWETRMFDLTVNGQWSRYLSLQQLSQIDVVPSSGLPGINLFTQDALINGKNQVNAYARIAKQFHACALELSYNFFYTQQESITQVATMTPGYGIYDMGTGGGVTTASTATIADYLPINDGLNPVQVGSRDLNLASGAAGTVMNNSIAARLTCQQENYTYGFGASVDLAATVQAISTWSVWFNIELLLPS